MEKAGGLLNNDKIAQKGHQKREQAGYGDNTDSYGSSGNTGSSGYGSANTDSYGSGNNNNSSSYGSGNNNSSNDY
jgi:hypothetical protein